MRLLFVRVRVAEVMIVIESAQNLGDCGAVGRGQCAQTNDKKGYVCVFGEQCGCNEKKRTCVRGVRSLGAARVAGATELLQCAEHEAMPRFKLCAPKQVRRAVAQKEENIRRRTEGEYLPVRSVPSCNSHADAAAHSRASSPADNAWPDVCVCGAFFDADAAALHWRASRGHSVCCSSDARRTAIASSACTAARSAAT